MESNSVNKINKWQRVHPLTPYLDGGLVIIAALSILSNRIQDAIINAWFYDLFGIVKAPNYVDNLEGAALEVAEDNGLPTGVLFWLTFGTIVSVLCVIIWSYILWLNSRYRVTNKAVEINTGVISSTTIRIPIEKVQTVSISLPLIARVFNLAKLLIITAGGTGKTNLRYLKISKAQQLREQILGMSGEGVGTEPTGGGVDGGESTEFTGSGEGEGLGAEPAAGEHESDAHPTSNIQDLSLPHTRESSNLSAKAMRKRAKAKETALQIKNPDYKVNPILFIISWLFTSATVFLAFLIALQVFVVVNRIWALIVPFVILAIPRLISMIGELIVQATTRIVLDPKGISVYYGVFTANTETISYDKIHALRISQSIFWRFFSWWRVEIITASGANFGRYDLVRKIVPVASVSEATRISTNILRKTNYSDAQIKNWLLAKDTPEKTAKLFSVYPKVALKVIGLAATKQWLYFDEEYLVVCAGWWKRSLSLVSYDSVQSLYYRQGWWAKLFGLTTVFCDSVPGRFKIRISGLFLEDTMVINKLLRAKFISTAKK